MKNKKCLKIIILLSSILITFIFFMPFKAHAQRAIKVGILDPYTGPAAVYAQDALNGFKLALEEINKTGVLGTKIEFTTRDTKFKAECSNFTMVFFSGSGLIPQLYF